MTTKEEIKEWLISERAENCSHMLVVCDTFDYEDFPVYVKKDENIQTVIKSKESSFLRIMEIYNLSMNIEKQLSERRAWNI